MNPLQAITGLSNKLPGSTPGSKRRNILSLWALLIAIGLSIEIVAASLGWALFLDDTLSRLMAFVFALYAAILFWILCIGVIFLHTQDRPIAATRLLRDTTISAVYAVISFGLLYRYLGTTGANVDGLPLCYAPDCATGPIDQLYLSLVTFTTLGYGDSTVLNARLIAAFQAALGNLHLGIFVGTVFYYLSSSPKTGRRLANDAQHDEHDGADAGERQKSDTDVE